MDVFFTHEISDFKTRNILLNNNIDGEVSVHRPHLVAEAQGNTLDYVLYVTADSVNGGQFLSISSLFVNLEALGLLSKKTEFYIDVAEVLPQGASGPFSITVHPFRMMSTFSGMWTV